MVLAIDALTIFMRSLPVGSKFSIISFGDNHETMYYNANNVIDYSDASKDSAISSI